MANLTYLFILEYLVHIFPSSEGIGLRKNLQFFFFFAGPKDQEYPVGSGIT